MTEQEKVIKALQKEIDEATYPVRPRKFMFPLELAEQILALLEAQEPRLLSVEKVVGYVVLKRDATLWFEFRNGIKEMNTKDIVYNDFLCDEDFPTLADPNLEWEDGGKRDGVIIAEYNDTFRCWTSRPSDEQRRNTPWT